MEGDDNQFFQLQDEYQYVGIQTGSESVDRVPQWRTQETRDLLVIRGDLDPDFTETNRNRFLWEMVSTRMREMGHNRSSAQCKYKWKNLVTRYKACEIIEQVEMRQSTFMFYNQMEMIFNRRVQRLMLQEAEDGPYITPVEALQIPSNNEEEEGANGRRKKRRKVEKTAVECLKEIMEECMEQQLKMEMEWIRYNEEMEKRRKEMKKERRQRMEAMENERTKMLMWQRQKDEERKVREEARAERRDVLITALLNKLRAKRDRLVS